MRGEGGSDRLYGGIGADRFIFAQSSDLTFAAYDRAIRFAKGTDRIDLSGIDANATLSGSQSFSFTADRPFFTSVGDVWTTSGQFGDMIEGDLNGDGVADLRILVTSTGTFRRST